MTLPLELMTPTAVDRAAAARPAMTTLDARLIHGKLGKAGILVTTRVEQEARLELGA